MGKKAIFQAVGAVLLGLNAAIPIFLDAKDLFPHWPMQYHSLLGFIAFCFFIGWIIYSKQRQIDKDESGSPPFALGNQTGATIQLKEESSEMHVALGIFFKPKGLKPAYQFRLNVGSAPDGHPNQFAFIPPEMSNANRIDPNSDLEYGAVFRGVQKYEQKDGKQQMPFRGLLIFCVLNYTDSPLGGKSYSEEWWLSYNFTSKLMGALSLERKGNLEPYVRLAYSKLKGVSQ